jgi:glutathione S-transferase
VTLHEAISKHARGTLAAAYEDIERKLADGRSYALAHGYTVVDPFLLVLYRWGARIGLPMADIWRSSQHDLPARLALYRS